MPCMLNLFITLSSVDFFKTINVDSVTTQQSFRNKASKEYCYSFNESCRKEIQFFFLCFFD